ncbi:MAG: Pr6Pr family membrane protein [Microbacteriaceae bacterium]|jgi:hypothetical protein|nr:Pr6Pr family membrane protein [Microbacteriaceae bacterium]MCI1206887.1 Pr6Pr family membrane protein [Microbacteriaceae bacterium]
MFTTQSNLLCAGYFTVAALRLWMGRDRGGRAFAPALKGMATMGVTVTLLVAWLILGMSIGFSSASAASLLGLHVLVPILAVADWPLFSSAGSARWKDPWLWVLAPVGYLAEFVLVLVSGGSLGAGHGSRAPYPFLDVDALGVGGVTRNVIAMAIGVILLGYLAVVADKMAAFFTHRRERQQGERI